MNNFMPKVSEFKWKEMFNNSQGKTSGMLFVCTIACFNAAMCFSTAAVISLGASLYGAIYSINIIEILPPDLTMFLRDIMMQSIALFALGASGLGVRRFTTDKPVVSDSIENK
jgi:hypothetical protein